MQIKRFLNLTGGAPVYQRPPIELETSRALLEILLLLVKKIEKEAKKI